MSHSKKSSREANTCEAISPRSGISRVANTCEAISPQSGIYLKAFLLVASLFFLWGFAHSILDVLNKHFQDVLVISKARSGLVQAMVYGAYFLMAIPAGRIIRRWGYRAGVVTGLVLYGIGALMFVPAGETMSFPFFLACLFVIGCGLTCLETSANPYVTVLGDPDTAASRINLAQSLNGLGWIVGPLVGGLVVLGDGGNVALPYAVMGVVVLAMGFIFSRINLPEINEDIRQGRDISQSENIPQSGDIRQSRNISRSDYLRQSRNISRSDYLRRSRNISRSEYLFIMSVAALFLYVAAQTGINSFFINYAIESGGGVSAQEAAYLLSFGGMGLFLVGRLAGAAIMRRVKPAVLVLATALCATASMAVVIFADGMAGMAALCATYIFESVMFPTIFVMGLAPVHGAQKKSASSILIMSIVGGAIAPVAMGAIGEQNIALGFALPLICFICIALYSWWYTKAPRSHGEHGD